MNSVNRSSEVSDQIEVFLLRKLPRGGGGAGVGGPAGNYGATTAPTATDDSSKGYSAGSVWIDTVAQKAYTCVKSTIGAAVWRTNETIANWSEITGIPMAFFATPHAASHIAGAEYDEITSALNVLAYPMPASLYNDMPSAGRAGVFWYATDRKIIYRDNGSNWDVVSVTQFLDLAGLRGSTNPASPSANDLFFRTDQGLWIYYDGTRWLSSAEQSLGRVELSFSADGSARIGKLRIDRTPYITRVSLLTNVATTNDATNYWTITLRGRDAALSASSNVHQVNTSAHTAGVFTESEAAPSVSSLPANRALLDIDAVKTGAPGALTVDVVVYYRYSM